VTPKLADSSHGSEPMKRFWLAAAAAAGMAAGATAADPVMAPVVPLNAAVSAAPISSMAAAEAPSYPVDPATQRFGLMPMLRKAVWWKPNYGACDSCEGEAARKHHGLKGLGHGGAGHGGAGQGGGGYGGTPGAGVPGYPQPGQPGMGMPGTLVFPHHQFSRSPRDFFMYGQDK